MINWIKRLFTRKKDIKPWYKYYDGIPKTLNYPKITIYELIEKTAHNYPGNYALEYFGHRVTYAELLKKIDIVTKSLKELGIGKNDRVTICMPNTITSIVTFYAVNKLGAVANMIHPLSSENEIELYLSISKSKYVLILDMIYAKVSEKLSKLDLDKIIISSVSDEMPSFKAKMYYFLKGRKLRIAKTSSIIFWQEFVKLGVMSTKEIKNNKKYQDGAVILYSGGTTGEPKGIMLSNLNFNALAMQCHLMCDPAKAGDSILSIMPIFHGFGLGVCIHTPLYIGMKCILVPDFSQRKFSSLIKKYKPNFIVGVPTLYEALIKSNMIGKKDLSCVTCVVSGGDTLSLELKKSVDEFLTSHGSKTHVREGYGLTESVAACCLTPSKVYKESTIGIPFPDMNIIIVSPNTHDVVEANTDGEICINGPTVMMGYINEEQENALALQVHKDGKVWLHTGDMGYMDESGFVYFKQRLKRIIVSSGYNIYPSYIENVINSHPKVFTSTVIGIKHPYKVQVAKAFIVLIEGEKPTLELKKSIKEYCAKNLSKYSIPYEFEYLDKIPTTLVGKVAYKKLEEGEKRK